MESIIRIQLISNVSHNKNEPSIVSQTISFYEITVKIFFSQFYISNV